jgi:LmbE family N-acetylglucosaminyl deacetylase
LRTKPGTLVKAAVAAKFLVTRPPGHGEGSFPLHGLAGRSASAWVDFRDYSDQKYDALHAHESQADDIFFLKLERQRFRQLMGEETFVHVIDTTQAPVPERDLFAGLA